MYPIDFFGPADITFEGDGNIPSEHGCPNLVEAHDFRDFAVGTIADGSNLTVVRHHERRRLAHR